VTHSQLRHPGDASICRVDLSQVRRHLAEIERAEELSAQLRLLSRTAKCTEADELRAMIDEGRKVGVSHKVWAACET